MMRPRNSFTLERDAEPATGPSRTQALRMLLNLELLYEIEMPLILLHFAHPLGHPSFLREA